MDSITKDILKVTENRKHKVSNSLGVYDAYKWVRKNKWFGMKPISEHTFYTIIRTLNKELLNKFYSIGYIKFPQRMGELTLQKGSTKFSLEGSKIKTNLPIDWKRTLELWKEDKESYNNKTLIYKEFKTLYKIVYNKSKANFNNKAFYSFLPNRIFKNAVSKLLIEHKLDAL